MDGIQKDERWFRDDTRGILKEEKGVNSIILTAFFQNISCLILKQLLISVKQEKSNKSSVLFSVLSPIIFQTSEIHFLSRRLTVFSVFEALKCVQRMTVTPFPENVLRIQRSFYGGRKYCIDSVIIQSCWTLPNFMVMPHLILGKKKSM